MVRDSERDDKATADREIEMGKKRETGTKMKTMGDFIVISILIYMKCTGTSYLHISFIYFCN